MSGELLSVKGNICVYFIQGFPKHTNYKNRDRDRDRSHTGIDRERELNTALGFLYIFPSHLLINIVFSGSNITSVL